MGDHPSAGTSHSMFNRGDTSRCSEDLLSAALRCWRFTSSTVGPFARSCLCASHTMQVPLVMGVPVMLAVAPNADKTVQVATNSCHHILAVHSDTARVQCSSWTHLASPPSPAPNSRPSKHKRFKFVDGQYNSRITHQQSSKKPLLHPMLC